MIATAYAKASRCSGQKVVNGPKAQAKANDQHAGNHDLGDRFDRAGDGVKEAHVCLEVVERIEVMEAIRSGLNWGVALD